jgi:pimeloyl-ACP methyl ester carboxylesterase
MIAKKNLLLSVVLLISFIFTACDSDSSNSAALATDYSKAAHWLSIPAVVEKVDIFYLYPTAWTSTDPDNPHVCAIDEPTMLTQAPQAFARQATAFQTVGNIYAPFYRQDNGSSIDRLNVIAGIPTLDAIAAFDYYIKHFNNNRPYILVGHSQGATVLSNLLSEYMKDHPDVYSRMVAAYVIGNPITDAYLAANPHLKFAEGPDDTGVIISYNTQAAYFFTQDPPVPPNPVLYGMVGRVINPINWKTDETHAYKSESLGSFMPDYSLVLQTMPHYADAQIDIAHGVLICSTAEEPFISDLETLAGFPKGVYHSFDIPLYYYDLRTNAQNRVNQYLGP